MFKDNLISLACEFISRAENDNFQQKAECVYFNECLLFHNVIYIQIPRNEKKVFRIFLKGHLNIAF